MAQKLKPRLKKRLIKLVKGPFFIDGIVKGQSCYKHPRTLLELEIRSVENGDTDGKPLCSSDPFEINGKRHIKHSEGRHSLFHTEGINGMIEDLGQIEALPAAHRAYGGTVYVFQDRGLPGFLQDLLPVALVFFISRRGKILLLLLHMKLIVGRLGKLRLLSRQEIEIRLSDPVAYHHLRPSVGNDMMKLHQHPAFILTGAEKNKPIEGTACKWNGLPGHGSLPAFQPLTSGMRKIENRKYLILEGLMNLHRRAVFHNDPGPHGGI